MSLPFQLLYSDINGKEFYGETVTESFTSAKQNTLLLPKAKFSLSVGTRFAHFSATIVCVCVCLCVRSCTCLREHMMCIHGVAVNTDQSDFESKCQSMH